jgi:uncharacterized protein (UPF0548 family)
MFLTTKPSDQQIRAYVLSLAGLKYSYHDVGATASTIPRSYTIDHNRVQLGNGADTWACAIKGVQSWQMFNLGWVRLCWPHTPIRCGENVAILVRHFGFHSLNNARIVYLVADGGPVKRFGFAYGTLTDHAESGEERFVVEWDQRNDSVYYDLLAFSKPNQLLSQVGFPISRMFQKRFASHSKEAMVRFVRSAGTPNVHQSSPTNDPD